MTIDPKLKEAVAEKIQLAKREMKDDPGLKVRLEKQGQKTSLGRDRKCPKNALLILVERKLRKQRVWKALRVDLVTAALWEIIRDFERKQAVIDSTATISAAKEKQLALFPGFEHLPTRIRTGNNFLQFHQVTVDKFLAYEKVYRRREQQNHDTAQELRRLAVLLEPLADVAGLTVAAAYEQATFQKQAAPLRVVK
jgi:hypothetical protein